MSGPTGVVKGRMLPQGASIAGAVPELRCRVNDADRLPVRSGAVTVECSLFGSGYRFYARVTDRRGDVLTLSPSPKLREWHRRGEERTALGPAERRARQLPPRADRRAPRAPARPICRRTDSPSPPGPATRSCGPACRSRTCASTSAIGLQSRPRWRSAPCHRAGSAPRCGRCPIGEADLDAGAAHRARARSGSLPRRPPLRRSGRLPPLDEPARARHGRQPGDDVRRGAPDLAAGARSLGRADADGDRPLARRHRRHAHLGPRLRADLGASSTAPSPRAPCRPARGSCTGS